MTPKSTIRVASLILCAALITSAGEAQAVNYFNWGVETSKVDYGVNGPGAYDVQPFGGTTLDCTVRHAGSCSMRLDVIGNDSGNQSMGVDTIEWNPAYPWDIVGSPAVYYRFWMRIMPGFSWGDGTAKTKSSRVMGTTYPRVYTGYVHAGGFNIGECDDVGSSQPGGGCVDPGPNISYDMTGEDDGLWHEYVVKVRPNTSATCTQGVNCDGQFEVWIDGVSVGTINDFKLHNKTGNVMNEAWGGWMVSPYFQLNGTVSDGGTMYLDDFSTDDVFNSTFSGPDTTPPGAPIGLGVQ